MQEQKSNLSVSTEVLEKIAELAACEVEGVSGLSKKAIDLKDAVKSRNPFKGIKIENINGAITINAYITLKPETKMRAAAEAVQASIKEKIQNMTGAAVTRVNVIVADLEEAADASKQ